MHPNLYEQTLRTKGKPLFIPFAVLGDPDKKQSVETIRLLVQSGADALELGFPFSDPPADGPVIQAADTRALAAGIRIDDCFEMLKEIRTFTNIPVSLLVYYNLILQRGAEKFYQDCADSGVTSVLVADLPLEHAADVVTIAKSHKIAPVFLISEVTTDERLKEISKIAEGYLYVVSYLGITGMGDAVFEGTMGGVIKKVRLHTTLPLFVGFGIGTPEQVRSVIAAGADGVIVGSRIVKERSDPEKVRAVCAMMANALR